MTELQNHVQRWSRGRNGGKRAGAKLASRSLDRFKMAE
jgi:hypothetical protein